VNRLHAPTQQSAEDLLAAHGQAVNAYLTELLAAMGDSPARLTESIRYSLMAGGKRLRPALVLETFQCCAAGAGRGASDAAFRSALAAAGAMELIHTFSLVHDDLPAMDNSDLRRGRPTCHKAFDDATAVLAGDGLLTMAFEVLADPDTHGDPAVRCELVASLAQAAGSNGMVGGQMIDLLAEHRSDLDIGAITRLQRLKTGALIAFACEAGAILGKAPQDLRLALRGYAHDLGLAFQIADDLLDVEGSSAATGKPVGADAAAGKATFVSILGVERARAQASLLVNQAVAHLEPFEGRAQLLRDVARFVVDRQA